MGLPDATTWPIAATGIQSKVAPLMLAAGGQLVLDNVRQERKDEWRTRSGFTVAAADALPGANIPVCVTGTPSGGFFGLCRQTDASTAARIYTPHSTPRWHSPPINNLTKQQACSQTTPGLWTRTAVAPMKGIPSAWSAAEGGGLRLSAWWSRVANSGVQVALTSTDGTSIFYSPSIGVATAVRPQCVYSSVANVLSLFFIDPASGALASARWDCSTGAQIGGITVLAADAYNIGTGSGSFLSALWYGGATITVAYRNQTAGGNLGWLEFNPATGAVTVPTAFGIDASLCIALLPDPDASGTRYVAISAAGPIVKVLRISAAAAVLSSDNADAVDAPNIAGTAYQSTTGTPGWMIVYVSTGAPMRAVKRRNGVTSAAKDLFTAGTVGLGLATNAWREPGTDSMRFMGYISTGPAANDLQGNFYEMALEFENGLPTISNYWTEPQARLLPLNAGSGFEERGAVPQVQRVGTDRFLTCLPRITRDTIAGSPVASQFDYAIDDWHVQYMNASTYTGQNQGQGTSTQQCAYLPVGTLLQTATGQLPCSHGASALPFRPILTPSTGAGLLTILKRYDYVVTVVMTDELGNEWESEPSNPASLTLTGTDNTISVQTFLTPLENATRYRTLKLWRTDGDGSAFKLLYVLTDTIANTSAVVFLDTIEDTILDNGQPLTGELGGTITPSFSHVVLWNRRLWGVSRDFPSQIWFSKPISTGTSPIFVGDFVIDLSDEHGDLTGLAPLDDKIAAFKGRAIYVGGGDGPGNNGAGSFVDFNVISSETGAIAGAPMVSTGREIYMVSLGGVFRLGGAQGVDFVGAPIDLYLSMPLLQSPETVTGMAVSPGQNEVRIQTTNYRFVHDRIFDIFIRDTGGMGASSGIVMTRMLGGTQQAMFTAAGALWLESADTAAPTDAGIAYAGTVRTAWIRPKGVEGWLRLYRARVLGECTVAGVTAQPTLTVFYDSSNALFESFQPVESLTAGAGPIRAEGQVRRQKCGSFSLQLTLPVGDASVRLDAWSATVELLPGAQPLSLGQKWRTSALAVAPCPPCPACTPVYPQTFLAWQPPVTITNTLFAQSDWSEADLWIRFANQLVAFGWTVVGSSNATVAAMDGVMRVLTYVDWGSFAVNGRRGWVVLQNGGGAQLLMWMDGLIANDYANVRFNYSPDGGYTGGAAPSTLPTAPHSINIDNGTSAMLGQSPDATAHIYLNMTCSVDVTCTRVVVCAAGILYNFWAWDQVRNQEAGWPTRNYSITDIGGNNRAAPGHTMVDASHWHGSSGFVTPLIASRGPAGFAVFAMSGYSGDVANATDDVYVLPATSQVSGLPLVPSIPTLRNVGSGGGAAGQNGQFGTMTDMLLIPRTFALGNITTYPGYAAFFNILIPWSGSTPPRLT